MHKLVIDVEGNSLDNPTKIWCIVTKNLDTGVIDVYRNLTEDEEERKRFLAVWESRPLWIGHNVLGWDFTHLRRLLGVDTTGIADRTIDTLVLSKLIDYPRDGHSLESYGVEFGFEKLVHTDFSKLSEELVVYCTRDVEVTEKIFLKYQKVVRDPKWRKSIKTEHNFQWRVVNALQDNGFAFDRSKCKKLLDDVTEELKILDAEIDKFPFRVIRGREVSPQPTRFGTLNKKDFRGESDLCKYNGGPFTRISYEPFNAASIKQQVDLLWRAGWQPEDRTKTSILTDREVGKLVRDKADPQLIEPLLVKQEYFKKYGWKVNETNLATLPNTAPAAARTLARRILVEARRRSLTEWSNLVHDTGRIHGRFQGIGAWTHRMAHQKPNMANIPNELDLALKRRYLGAEMRSLFIAPKNRLLVGVDAASIQLRIFAHYIDDAAFTKAIVDGKKEDNSDPHSLNQRIIGKTCKSRAASKRFIFAMLLGAGEGKLAEILECNREGASAAIAALMERYDGFNRLKQTIIPADAKRGWFFGLDGRKVRIPGDDLGSRRHLAMSGYLQNGEAVVMKMATLLAMDALEEKFGPDWFGIWLLVNLVHDEWQTECINVWETAIAIAEIYDKALQDVGVMLQLKCPLAGSFYEDNKKGERVYTIGTNWKLTH